MRSSNRSWRAIAEGVFVLAGILLAFWIDASWEGRQDAELQRALASAVLAEAVQNRAHITEQLDDARRFQSTVDAFFEIVPGSVSESSDTVPALRCSSNPSSACLFRHLMQVRTVSPSLGATQAFAESPLDAREALVARSLLNRWIQALADVERFAEPLEASGHEVGRLMQPYALRYIDSGRDDVPVMVARGGWDAAVTLRADTTFGAAVLNKAFFQDIYIFQAEQSLPLLDSLIVALEEG